MRRKPDKIENLPLKKKLKKKRCLFEISEGGIDTNKESKRFIFEKKFELFGFSHFIFLRKLFSKRFFLIFS